MVRALRLPTSVLILLAKIAHSTTVSTMIESKRSRGVAMAKGKGTNVPTKAISIQAR